MQNIGITNPTFAQSIPLDLSIKPSNQHNDPQSCFMPGFKTLRISAASTSPQAKMTEEITNCKHHESDRNETTTTDKPEDSPCCSLSSLHRFPPNFHDDPCRRHRTAFTRTQTSRLEKEFQKDNYLSRSKRTDLSKELHLLENTIKVSKISSHIHYPLSRWYFDKPYIFL